MRAYYNDFDADACEALTNLIAAGLIPPGDVDNRSIKDVRARDLDGYTQVHFFAGLGGWPYALRLAGWPDDRPVWTGSCPCQPFSAAGKGEGIADPRHLWPDMHRLISECRPVTVMGEQVDAAIRLGWLDAVLDDLERDGYAGGAIDIPAAGIGAPNIRQRLWWRADRLADAGVFGREPRAGDVGICRADNGQSAATEQFGAACAPGGLADADNARLEGRGQPGRECAAERLAGPGGMACRLEHGAGDGRDARRAEPGGQHGQQPQDGGALRGGYRGARAEPAADMGRPGPVNGFWRDADWLFCRDAKWRPAEPGTFPLADGLSAGMVAVHAGGQTKEIRRNAALKLAGNAINPHVAAAFVRVTEGWT